MGRKKGTILALTIVLIISGLIYASCKYQYQKSEDIAPELAIKDTVLAQVKVFNLFIKDTFLPAVNKSNSNQKDLQRLFLKARILYKKFEWAAEYFMGNTTNFVNGPPVQEVENADLLNPALAYAMNPSGLQVMEEMLYPQYDAIHRKALIKQLNLLQSNCKIYIDYFSGHPISSWRILDAARLEVFRILTLGITGYDDPLSLNCMNESAISLESLKKILSPYTLTVQDTSLIPQINAAILYLRKNTGFNSFNRAFFITHYGNKISASVTKLQQELNLPDIKYNRLLNQRAKTLFDTDAFNVNAFAPGQKYFMAGAKVKLGKRLFYDVSLSGTGARSCASCHQPDKAFTDGLVKNISIHGHKLLPRNTPTLINAALQSNLFYDMRALTLEDQAHDVIENKEEMDGSLKNIIKYLSRNKTYRKLFSKAFPEKKSATIDSAEVLNAIASYVRSLTKFNSRFDQYMRGDSTALTGQEVKGFNLFMGKAKCATCHFMPLFNGITPPKYIVSDAEVIGVPSSLADTAIDPDMGWYNIVGIPSYKHAFKTPTLRNAARTAPYMHNGVFANLKEVMNFYNNGGGAGMGLKIGNQTLSKDSLHLSENEIQDIIAFIKSLN